MTVISFEAPARAGEPMARARGRGRTTPLYVVCSPRRGVGKTLVARLLAEFYMTEGQPVSLFDFADEGPRLADFLPGITELADIGDTSKEMAFFDRLMGEPGSDERVPVRIIDLSYREFGNFFVVARKIGFFEEARSRGMDPYILYLIDPEPNSADAYALLRREFPHTAMLPVRNQIVAEGIPYCSAFLNASSVPVVLELAVLGPAAKAMVDRTTFSFAKSWRKANSTGKRDDELRAWVRRSFLQFREIELWRICDEILAALE
jgi:hypothetical protein